MEKSQATAAAEPEKKTTSPPTAPATDPTTPKKFDFKVNIVFYYASRLNIPTVFRYIESSLWLVYWTYFGRNNFTSVLSLRGVIPSKWILVQNFISYFRYFLWDCSLQLIQGNLLIFAATCTLLPCLLIITTYYSHLHQMNLISRKCYWMKMLNI